MNGTMMQAFSWYLPADGAHWKALARDAQLFADEGITAVWLPPAYKGMAGPNDVGYGVYDLYDLGEFDQKGSVRTKYGTRQEYLDAVAALKGAGMQVLADVVLNQRMGADACEPVWAEEVSQSDRERQTSGPERIGAWTKFTFPGRKGAYSDFQWDWSCFHGVDYDEYTKRHGIWLFQGKHWDEDVERRENGNFDYLMGCDVDVCDPRVYDELVRWGKWYLDTTGVDGFRLDAVKHMSRSFFLRWLDQMRRYTGRELFTVGEYWSPDVGELQGYLGGERAMSLLDVPLHYHLYNASDSFGNQDLSKIFDGTLVQRDPIHAVTFVENHDTQPRQSLQSSVEEWFKPSAYALILLRQEGYPCVFEGDLFGMPNDGEPAVRQLPLLMEIRRRFAYGQQRDWIDDPDVIGWTREGDIWHAGSGCAVVLTDRNGGTKHMCVGQRNAGQRWLCVMGDEASVNIGPDGWGDFPVGPGKLSVYLPEAATRVLQHDYHDFVRDAKAFVNPSPAD
ncbi:MAG: alpha-amylase [Atopobiaceae bacterium]